MTKIAGPDPGPLVIGMDPRIRIRKAKKCNAQEKQKWVQSSFAQITEPAFWSIQSIQIQAFSNFVSCIIFYSKNYFRIACSFSS